MRAIGDVINKIIKGRHLTDANEMKKKILGQSSIQNFLRQHQQQITPAIVKNSWSNLYAYYTQCQRANKVMTGYRPELFMNGKVIDVRYAPTPKKLARDKVKATVAHLQLIDLPPRLHQVKLSNVDANPGRRLALGAISKFLAVYPRHPHQKGLYLSGNFGVGKTYLLAGLANSIAAGGRQVVFLHVPTFIAGLSSHFKDDSLEAEIQRVARCDVLILDDIGAESLSQWSRDDVLGVILQARMDNVLPTFFSSNFDMERLKDHFANTKNAVDPVKAERLMQRIRFLAKEVVVTGPNRRKF